MSNTEDMIKNLVVGDTVDFKKVYGYPFAPGAWFWYKGTYIGKWSVDEICVKCDGNPWIVNVRNLKDE